MFRKDDDAEDSLSDYSDLLSASEKSVKDSSFASSDSSLDSEAIARNKRRAKKKEREAERRLEKIDAACCFRLESNPIRD